jgi:hypothetical protein
LLPPVDPAKKRKLFMQSKTAQLLKARLRKNFGDDFGIQWSDTLLDRILFEAQREYAIYTGCLVGRYNFSVGPAPVQSLPDDFFRIIRAIDVDGCEIPIVSYRKLADDYGDFRNKTGSKIKALCFNFDGFGKFRIFPQLTSDSIGGTLIYSRLPDKSLLEVKNLFAVEQYCLFQMYQFVGKSQAKNCYLSFIDQVNKDRSDNLASGNKHIARTGVYF